MPSRPSARCWTPSAPTSSPRPARWGSGSSSDLERRKSAPPVSLTGKTSNAEQTFGEMLDTKRADELSKTGSLGIGKILEQQLRASVLGEARGPAPAPATEPEP